MSGVRDFKAEAQRALCNDNEDMKFIAACAVTGNFDLLLDGRVRYDLMRPVPSIIAKSIIDQRSTRNWPPSYAALKAQFQFDGIDWPTFSDDVQNLSPEWYASAFNDSVRRHKLMMLSLDTLMQVDRVDDDKYQEFLRRSQEQVRLLQELGSKAARPTRLGEVSGEILDALIGQSLTHSRVEMAYPWLNHLLGVVEPGIYAFFARPKNGKSFATNDFVVHNGVSRRIPGILIDPENDRKTVLARIACSVAKLPFRWWKHVRTKFLKSQDMRISAEERAAYEMNHEDWEVVKIIQRVSDEIDRDGLIYIIGKDKDVSPEHNFNLDRILKIAEDISAEWLAVEQIHKAWTANTKSTDNENVRTQKACRCLSSREDLVYFVTTQENRSTQMKDQEASWHFPSTSTVYGSDSLGQEAVFICHLRMFEVSSPVVEYIDRINGTTVGVDHIQCFYPLAARNARGVGRDAMQFRAFDAYGYDEWLPYQQGYGFLDEDLKHKREKLEQSRGTQARSKMSRQGQQTQAYTPTEPSKMSPAAAIELMNKMRR